jgi:thymidine phosphorylase
VTAQGGDPAAKLPVAPVIEPVRAERDGVVATMDAYAFGVGAWRLGAGRARKEDPVSASAGIVLHRRPGDRVRAGDVLFELRAEQEHRVPDALGALLGAVTIADSAPPERPLIVQRIA